MTTRRTATAGGMGGMGAMGAGELLRSNALTPDQPPDTTLPQYKLFAGHDPA